MKNIDESLKRLIENDFSEKDALLFLKEVFTTRISSAPSGSKIEDSLYNSLETIHQKLKEWEE